MATQTLTHRFSPSSSLSSRSSGRDLSPFFEADKIEVRVADFAEEAFFSHLTHIQKINCIFQKINAFLPAMDKRTLKEKFFNFRPVLLGRFPLAFSLLTIPQYPSVSEKGQQELIETKKFYKLTSIALCVSYLASCSLFFIQKPNQELLLKGGLASLLVSLLLNVSQMCSHKDLKHGQKQIEFYYLKLQQALCFYKKNHRFILVANALLLIFSLYLSEYKKDRLLDLPFLPSFLIAAFLINIFKKPLIHFLEDNVVLFRGILSHQKLLVASKVASDELPEDLIRQMHTFLQIITHVSLKKTNPLHETIERLLKVKTETSETIERLAREILKEEAELKILEIKLEKALEPAILAFEKKYLLGKFSVITTGLHYDPQILKMCPQAESVLSEIYLKKREISYLKASCQFHENKQFESIQPLFSKAMAITHKAFDIQQYVQRMLGKKLKAQAEVIVVKKQEAFCFEIHKLLFQQVTPWLFNTLIISAIFDRIIQDATYSFSEKNRSYTILALDLFSWMSFIFTIFQFIALYNKSTSYLKKDQATPFGFSPTLFSPLKEDMQRQVHVKLKAWLEQMDESPENTPLEPRSRSASPLFGLDEELPLFEEGPELGPPNFDLLLQEAAAVLGQTLASKINRSIET
jgi:hypothetical protein